MRRREFFQLGCGALAFLERLPHSRAQERPKKSRIGYLTAVVGTGPSSFDEAFVRGLRDLGYVESENIEPVRAGGAFMYCPEGA